MRSGVNRYSLNGITILTGDALLILPTLSAGSVDAVITDPPYSSGGQSITSRKASPETKYQGFGVNRRYPVLLGDNRDQRSLLIWSSLWLTECWRIAKIGSPLLLFSDWRQLPVFSDAVQVAGWTWRGMVVWDKTESARPQIGAFRGQAEYIIFASKGKWEPLTSNCLPGVFRYRVNPNEKNHINAKPVPLMGDLLKILPDSSEVVVLDPFVGGGATAKACQNSNRQCIGIEQNPETVGAAVDFIEKNKVTTFFKRKEATPLFNSNEICPLRNS